MRFLFFFFFLTLLAAAAQAAQPSCNSGDRVALLQFKSSITNDANGALAGWKNNADCCRGWRGVKCNRTTGSVIQLKLSNNELRGSIHQSLGSLTNLVQLDLSNNHLTGGIPSSLTKLSQLQLLDLAYNYGISGRIPDKIGQMINLVRIRLQSNKLSGRIPPSFGLLNRLVYCELDDNRLEGTVPDGFVKETASLAFLELSKNKITALPKDLSNLKRLGILYMGSNPLGFNSIAGIATLPFLGELHLSNAGLRGAIPKWLSTLNLRQSDDFLTCNLDLSSNSITGGIPAELGNMTNLEGLGLQNNKLSGEIPKELLNLQSLRFFNVSHNMLRGQIPQGPPFISFDPASYAANPGLCGRPLSPFK